MIKRNLESTILEALDFFPAVGILGPRQVGKTTLVKSLMNQLNKASIYFDLEIAEDYETLVRNTTWVIDNNQDKTIVIDEIQRYLPLLPQLRGLIDRNRKAGRFILLGSASPVFLQKSSESLAGRVAYHELSPIGRLEMEQGNISENTHWLRGGYPDALLAPNDNLWGRWQQNFVKTYVEQDLSNLGMSNQSILVNNFLRMISHVHGGLLNYSMIASSLGISHTSVHRYIDVLEQAFLIRRLEPWFVNMSKRIVKSPKIYIRDSGNLHYLHNVRSFTDLTQNPVAGASWEGYVIEQIIQRLRDDISPYYYRTSNGAEMDLVLVQGLKPKVSIEIKLSLVPALKKGSTESVNDLKTEHNFVVTPAGGNLAIKQNWIHCNLKEVIWQLSELGIVS
ncbi:MULTISPECIES: ATP-binding protein [Emticicia]|uniref:ATP-binding protein n=1 Tax=Emticicia TaxID=312278 RepID=UPI0007D8BD33|nr:MULTISPECIES: ATP-binding protein [Emticicia]